MDKSRLPKRDKNEKTIWERLMSGAVDAGERARGRGVAPRKTKVSRPRARGKLTNPGQVDDPGATRAKRAQDRRRKQMEDIDKY